MAEYAIASAKQKTEHFFSRFNIDTLCQENGRGKNTKRAEMAAVSTQSSLAILEMESIHHALCYLESFLCSLRTKKHRLIDGVEQQIEDVVDRIEDLFGSHISSHAENHNSVFKVEEEITCLIDKLKKEEYKTQVDSLQVHFSSPDDEILFGSYDSILGSCLHPVGLDNPTRFLKYRVMRGSSNLKITVVYGMAGRGKTTLVKQVYSELLDDFDAHCMLTVSINFTLREILVHLLTNMGFHFDVGNKMMGESELEMSLMHHLEGKRYLCVLDNLWDFYTLKRLIVFFPNECNKSRIICTSRDANIGKGYPFLDFYTPEMLGDDNSWKLLHDMIFTDNESINPQLEEIGKEIAKKCEGLPLAIISMGKLLSGIEKTNERWKQVLEDDDPFKIRKYDGQPISKSLYLSYDRLPYHLKSCFLYMGVLPQNYDIKRSEIIRLWIAEGFITPKKYTSLEDTAMGYFQELYQKSMVLHKKIGVDGKTTYSIHFVFRCLCIREAQDAQFCLAIKKFAKIFPEGTNLQRRLCIHNNIVLVFKEVHNSMESIPLVSSIRYCGPRHPWALRVCLNFKCLKILHALNIRFLEFPLEVLGLIYLRYLAITYDGQLPMLISKLWKLEFLILGRYNTIQSSQGPSYLPVEIWNLQWLKHIQCTGFDLLDLNCNDDVLKFLSKLSGVSSHSCTPNILSRMPNLKNLAVRLELVEDNMESFSFFREVAQNLHCLDSFKCVVLQVFNSYIAPPIPIFPTTISKLSLGGCGFPWEYMSAISVLPNLATLKLKHYAFYGPVWEVSEVGFPRLKHLVMRDLNLKEWKAKSEHFPELSSLDIYHCYNLQEIPIEFGDIRTLSLMILYCNDLSLEKSMRRIVERRQHLEDDRLDVGISNLEGTKLYKVWPGDKSLVDESFISTKIEPKGTKT